MTKVRYKDDEMQKFESHTEMIRARPLMYIGLLGSQGANHCCREAINNHIDECSKPKNVTPGDTIWIEFNEKEDWMISSDNGRGINHTEVVEIFTTLNMGSNMSRSHGFTLGENGVGSLCITALAREAEIRTYRGLHEKVEGIYRFKEGTLVDEQVNPEAEKHGLVVLYKPSRKVFGKEARIDVDDMINWIRAFKYRMSPKITINLKATRLDGSVLEETIRAVPFKEIIVDNNENLLFEPESFSFNGDIDEEFGGTTQSRSFHVDLAFGYVGSDNVPYQSSFCNGAHTTDHGSHLDGVVNGITKFMRDQVNASMSDKEKEKITIQPTDVQTGLTISVNLMTDMMKLFVSQIKTKVDNARFAKVLANIVYENLSANVNKGQLKSYIEFIKTNAKARIEANLIRQKTMKEQSGRWDRYSIEQLIPCASTDKTKTELYICEGLSAKGALRIARDPQYQAIFSLKGFPLNPYGKSISQILANDEYRALNAALGCGIGENFNINKLKYRRIIIATDADMDGFGIRSLVASHFILNYPQIVAEGRLYIADPPLYQIDYRPQEYVTTKRIYYDICEKIYNKKWVHVMKDGYGWAPIKNSTLFRDAVDFDRLFRLTDIYRVDRNVMFSIVCQTARFMYDHSIELNLTKTDFINKIVRDIRYTFDGDLKEIHYERRDGYIAFAGVYNLKYCGIDFTYAAFTRLVPLISATIRLKPWEKIYLMDKKTKEVMLNVAEDPLKVVEYIVMLMPRIRDRMKGLGQTDKEILSRTTLDPATRTLICVNLNNDFETALNIIKTLRGNSMEDLHSRKAMLDAFDIDPDDIDT